MIQKLSKMVDVPNILVLFAALAYFHISDASVFDQFRSVYNPKIRNALPTEYSYKTLYMTQNVDHFGFDNEQTFQQRYLLANQFWNDDGGPFFFYTGNEGDITWFCNNTGFMWDSAPEFKALLVFAEHRYYGESLPYGAESYANNSMLNYLTSEQALADFAELIRYIKRTVPGATKSPVIVMGGSYGGMLATWMRLKYPNLVLGAFASSAPVWQLQGLSPCGSFYASVQNTFHSVSQQCVENIANSWVTYDEFYPGDLQTLSKLFSLCKPIEDKYALGDLLDWLNGIYPNLAMVNYPYPASFLEPLPAWPVKEFCKNLLVPLQGKDLVAAVATGVKMYFNYTGQVQCLDMTKRGTGELGDRGWDYQKCTEMVMPMCSYNSTMFLNSIWDISYYTFMCKHNLGVTPRENWISLNFWGKNITSASNIIFSNGMLDPWSGGGVLESLSPSLVAIRIPNGAHHLDLRAANPGDTADVRTAREQEKNIIRDWLYGPGH